MPTTTVLNTLATLALVDGTATHTVTVTEERAENTEAKTIQFVVRKDGKLMTRSTFCLVVSFDTAAQAMAAALDATGWLHAVKDVTLP